MAAASTPWARMRSHAVVSPFSSTSASTTSIPLLANRSANAKPIPLAAPVTTATFPVPKSIAPPMLVGRSETYVSKVCRARACRVSIGSYGGRREARSEAGDHLKDLGRAYLDVWILLAGGTDVLVLLAAHGIHGIFVAPQDNR
jgi:hypothetical protein